MKKIIILLSLVAFISCKPDRIDHTDKDGEDLYIYFNLNGERRHATAGDFYKYCDIKVGDKIIVKEQFYPYYHLYVIK